MGIEIWVSVGLAAAMTALARGKNALTWPAALTASGMLLWITCLSGLREAVALIGMYGLVLAVDLVFGKKMERATQDIQAKGGTRGLKQILANGTAGCVCVFLFWLTGRLAFQTAYYAAIFEVMADSIASDVGVLSKRLPRDICTWRTVPRGISGGVSVLGLSASGAACAAAGLMAWAALNAGVETLLILILAPYLGMLADSVIGSRFQVKYTCAVCGLQTEMEEHCGVKTVISGGVGRISNNLVNFICTVIAAAAGCLLAGIG